MKPLIAAKATTFVLTQKVAKSQVSSLGFFAAQTFPANQAKPGLEKFAAILRALANTLQKFLCPAITHKATTVLSYFIRSCSTDEDKKKAFKI